MKRVEPFRCCTEAVAAVDVWEAELAPDEIVCPKCGNVGKVTLFSKDCGAELGIAPGLVTVDGYKVTWYSPEREEVN